MAWDGMLVVVKTRILPCGTGRRVQTFVLGLPREGPACSVRQVWGEGEA